MTSALSVHIIFYQMHPKKKNNGTDLVKAKNHVVCMTGLQNFMPVSGPNSKENIDIFFLKASLISVVYNVHDCSLLVARVLRAKRTGKANDENQQQARKQ